MQEICVMFETSLFSLARSDFPAFQSAQAVIISPGPSMDIAVNLTIDDDEIVECNETFTLRLVSLDTVHLQIYPLRDQATVTIIDDDGLYSKFLIQYILLK